MAVTLTANLSKWKTVPISEQADKVASQPLTNTKYPNSGQASLQNQLGAGSPFYYLKDKADAQKVFSLVGYNDKRKYSDIIKPSTSLLLSKSTETNSPSALEEQYKKFNLRDNTNNIYDTYMKQPYVLRGIQREDKKEPQLWGIGRFDDGLIRGGATTAVERAALDTVRIAKWLASPKGLLWVVKQVGLGLTNPKVEAIGDNPLARQTRIHTGVASLLSVPGTAFGLHITRHGIPFANEASSYGAVQIAKTLLYRANKNSNRLVKLQGDLFSSSTITLNFLQSIGNLTNVSKKSIIQTAKGFAGLPITELSGNAGPQSVYGIGATPIRRVVDTVTDAVNNAKNSQFATSFDSKTLYAGRLRANTNNVFDASRDEKNDTVSRIDISDDPISLRTRLENDYYDDTAASPGAKKDGILRNLESADARNSTYDQRDGLIHQYEVVAYGKIPKKVDLKSFNDFRNNLSDNSNAFSGKITAANTDALSYENNNLENKKGFGQQGKVGADRSNPLEFFAPSKNYGRDITRRPWSEAKDKFRGDKITALDIVQSNTALTTAQVYSDEKDQIEFYFEDGDQGTNVMVFRCTMTGFSDSFSPGWSRIDIMGRPDGAYLYSSFERQVSFTFTAAATSRTEMIPMWRKLNYLASYTMPDFRAGNRPSGPFMRLTIGNLFKNTPGFINSLSYTIPDEATWDVDANNRDGEGKQLPNIVEVSVGFTVIADFRPQVMGRAYSMFAGKTGDDYDWLWDATINSKTAADAQAKYEEEIKKLNEESKANVTTTSTGASTTTPTTAPTPQLTEPGDVSVPNEPVNVV